MGNALNKGKRIKQKKIRMRHYANDIIIVYRLEEEIFDPESNAPRIAYNITVTKVDCGGTRHEVKELKDVTGNKEKAERIFNIISRGLVTPCTAEEVVSDLIGI